MFFRTAVIFQDLHATVAGNAVTDVDDEIALRQVEETVDGPRLQTPARQDLPRILAVEQLVIAEHDDADIDHAKAGADAAGDQT